MCVPSRRGRHAPRPGPAVARRGTHAPPLSPLQVRSIPVRKDDEVVVMRGKYKGRDGKVTAVYRKKFVVHVERIQREKANGAC